MCMFDVRISGPVGLSRYLRSFHVWLFPNTTTPRQRFSIIPIGKNYFATTRGIWYLINVIKIPDNIFSLFLCFLNSLRRGLSS